MDWQTFKKKVDGRSATSRLMIAKQEILSEEEKDAWFAMRMGDFYYRMKCDLGQGFTDKHKLYILQSCAIRKGVRDLGDLL